MVDITKDGKNMVVESDIDDGSDFDKFQKNNYTDKILVGGISVDLPKPYPKKFVDLLSKKIKDNSKLVDDPQIRFEDNITDILLKNDVLADKSLTYDEVSDLVVKGGISMNSGWNDLVDEYNASYIGGTANEDERDYEAEQAVERKLAEERDTGVPEGAIPVVDSEPEVVQEAEQQAVQQEKTNKQKQKKQVTDKLQDDSAKKDEPVKTTFTYYQTSKNMRRYRKNVLVRKNVKYPDVAMRGVGAIVDNTLKRLADDNVRYEHGGDFANAASHAVNSFMSKRSPDGKARDLNDKEVRKELFEYVQEKQLEQAKALNLELMGVKEVQNDSKPADKKDKSVTNNDPKSPSDIDPNELLDALKNALTALKETNAGAYSTFSKEIAGMVGIDYDDIRPSDQKMKEPLEEKVMEGNQVKTANSDEQEKEINDAKDKVVDKEASKKAEENLKKAMIAYAKENGADGLDKLTKDAQSDLFSQALNDEKQKAKQTRNTLKQRWRAKFNKISNSRPVQFAKQTGICIGMAAGMGMAAIGWTAKKVGSKVEVGGLKLATWMDQTKAKMGTALGAMDVKSAQVFDNQHAKTQQQMEAQRATAQQMANNNQQQQAPVQQPQQDGGLEF